MLSVGRRRAFGLAQIDGRGTAGIDRGGQDALRIGGLGPLGIQNRDRGGLAGKILRIVNGGFVS